MGISSIVSIYSWWIKSGKPSSRLAPVDTAIAKALIGKFQPQAGSLLRSDSGVPPCKGPDMGYPQNSWFIRENPIENGVIFGGYSSILMGFSLINQPFWGSPILGNRQIFPLKMKER